MAAPKKKAINRAYGPTTKSRNKGATGPGKGQLNDASVSTPGTVDRKGLTAKKVAAPKKSTRYK